MSKKKATAASSVNFPRYLADIRSDDPSQRIPADAELEFVVKLSLSETAEEILSLLEWLNKNTIVKFNVEADLRRDYRIVTIRCPYDGHFGVFQVSDPIAICVTFGLFFYGKPSGLQMKHVNAAWAERSKRLKEKLEIL